MTSNGMTSTHFALLDYDGFVCKAFFAAMARGEIDNAESVLLELTEIAIQKAKDFFETEDVEVFKVMSGHSWKKDLYPEYKAKRKRNAYIRDFRDYTLASQPDIFRPERLEADELIILMHDELVDAGKQVIVFSDDKDLKYYSKLHCGINVGQEVEPTLTNNELYVQLLAGDKEDCITGIPKVGKKTAVKLLDNEYTIEKVIQIYKEKEIDLDECIKQLVLTIPMSKQFNDNPYDMYTAYSLVVSRQGNYSANNNDAIDRSIEGLVKYVSNKVTEVYNSK
jgi:5'-3' exonuclease